MALDNAANEGLKVNFSNTLPGGMTYAGDQPIDPTKIVPVKSAKSKAVAKFLCLEKITLTFAVGTAPCPFTKAGFTFVSGSGSILSTAIKVKAEGKAILRLNDTGLCSGTWTNNSSGATVPCACNLKISDAGQTKVKGA